MNETIAQRPRHGKVDTTLGRRIAGGHHYPIFREVVFTEFAIEHKLITARLRHLRCGSQFVEKEDALAGGRQKLWWHPFCLICGDARQPAQIDRIKLNRSNVEELPVEIRGYLCNDLRLAHTARAPDVQRHTFGNERMERFKEFRGFHRSSFTE